MMKLLNDLYYFFTCYPFYLFPKGRIYIRGVLFSGKPDITLHDKHSIISINKGTQIGRGSFFYAMDMILIGENCRIAPNCVFVDNRSHSVLDKNICSSPIIIGNNVWVSYGCIILKGVHIGDNSVIGAGSVVTKDIPENSFACGNPAVVK